MASAGGCWSDRLPTRLTRCWTMTSGSWQRRMARSGRSGCWKARHTSTGLRVRLEGIERPECGAGAYRLAGYASRGACLPPLEARASTIATTCWASRSAMSKGSSQARRRHLPQHPQPTPTPEPIISIVAARALANGTEARVSGVLTTHLGALESGRKAFIQDDTGGIALYLDVAVLDGLPADVLVVVRGTLDERFAERTLRVAVIDIVSLGERPAPAAVGAPDRRDRRGARGLAGDRAGRDRRLADGPLGRPRADGRRRLRAGPGDRRTGCARRRLRPGGNARRGRRARRPAGQQWHRAWPAIEYTRPNRATSGSCRRRRRRRPRPRPRRLRRPRRR